MNRPLERISLASPVPGLDPSVFDAAVDGFAGRLVHNNAKPSTADRARSILERHARELGSPVWTAEAIETYGLSRAEAGIKIATRRIEHITVRRFCDYLLDPNYDWRRRFIEAYGMAPIQPISEANRLMHVEEDESGEHVRALTWNELDAFFARCDFLARNSFSKREQRTSLRDGTMYKVGAAMAFRCAEMADCRLSACAPAGDRVTFRDFGSIRIFGKSKAYGPPKPRTVYAIGLFKWLADVLEHHQARVMPLFANGDGDRMFTSEDGSPLDPAYVSKRFKEIREDAGLDKAVTAHGMRRLYATTCALHGVDGWFISQQLGHDSVTTTNLYIRVPTEFVDRTVRNHQKDIMHP